MLVSLFSSFLTLLSIQIRINNDVMLRFLICLVTDHCLKGGNRYVAIKRRGLCRGTLFGCFFLFNDYSFSVVCLLEYTFIVTLFCCLGNTFGNRKVKSMSDI